MVQTGEVHVEELDVHEVFLVPPRMVADTTAVTIVATLIVAFEDFVSAGNRLLTFFAVILSRWFTVRMVIFVADSSSANLKVMRLFAILQYMVNLILRNSVFLL